MFFSIYVHKKKPDHCIFEQQVSPVTLLEFEMGGRFEVELHRIWMAANGQRSSQVLSAMEWMLVDPKWKLTAYPNPKRRLHDKDTRNTATIHCIRRQKGLEKIGGS